MKDDDWDEQFGHGGGRKGSGNEADVVTIDSNVCYNAVGFMVNRGRARRCRRVVAGAWRRYEEEKEKAGRWLPNCS
jgi:hypothetical protein